MNAENKATRIAQIATSLDPICIGRPRPHVDDVKVIGGVADLRQPIPIKYQAVRERFKNAQNNMWFPSEIGMADDKLQWNTGALTEAEMWMFKLNISYLTASDNLVPDNLVDTIFPHITAVELRQYYRWQCAEEANHLESYLYILESFGLDEGGQGQIFNIYQEIPELANKLNWNLKFSNNLARSEAPIGSREASKLLLEDLIAYAVFEFLFFPCNFTQIFALANGQKLRQTAQQYQYIWRDETLHADNGIWVINQIIYENPYLWDDEMRERALAIIVEGVRMEAAYAKASMPDGGVFGLSLKSYLKYNQMMADQLCLKLGLPVLYDVKENPLPWMNNYALNQEVNFFEGRVREYRTGSQLLWD